MKYAEDLNYFDTTVHPAKSLGEIQEMLEDFGATATVVTQGVSQGVHAWLIRFQWHDRSYRFIFSPAPCRWPNKQMKYTDTSQPVGKTGKRPGKIRTNEEQSRYQMARGAYWFVKGLLAAAEFQPAALFGFLELPGARPGSMPPVASELDVEELTGLLPAIELPKLLEDGEQ